MAGKDDKIYTNESLEKLLNTISNNADMMAGALKECNKTANSVVREFNKFFSGTESEVKKILSSNDDLRQFHDDLVRQMDDLNKQIEGNVSMLNKLAESHRISASEAKNNIDQLIELKKITNDIHKLNRGLSHAKKPETIDRLNAAKADMQSKADELRRKMKSSNVGKLMLSEYEAQNKELRKAVDSFDAIDQSSEEVAKHGKQLQKALAQAKKDSDELDKAFKENKESLERAIDLAYKGFSKLANDAWEKYKEINQGVTAIGREMGLATSQITALQSNVFANYGKIANRLGMQWEDIAKFQTAYTNSTSKAVILANDTVEKLGVLSKYTGQEAANQILNMLDQFSMSASDATDVFALNMARAANQGLNLKSNSDQFVKNLQLASSYTFRNGLDGISRMTLLSQRLRFNFDAISGAIDKFSNIEDAIKTSASIQVLGGQYAANFSNPLLALGRATTDVEEFTESIISAISASAYFNREKGIVDMSPIEKMKLKQFANETGINYQVLWNIASQKAKESEISKQIAKTDLSEDQKAFLYNKSQYDRASGSWYVVNSRNERIDLKSLIDDKAMLTEIQKQNDVERSIQNDVSDIRSILDVYINRLAKDDKTLQEALKGFKEQTKIGTASVLDATRAIGVDQIVNRTHGMPDWGAIGLTVLGGALPTATNLILGKRIKKYYNKIISKATAKIFRNAVPTVNQPAAVSTTRTVASAVPSRAASSIGRFKPWMGTSLKAIGIVGTVGTVGYDLYQAERKFKQREAEINGANYSYKDRVAEINKLKERRNKERADAVLGDTWWSGALRGAGIGASFGPWGAAIGGAIGAGIYGLRQLFGENDTDRAKQKETIQVQQGEQSELSIIQEGVSKIRQNTEVIAAKSFDKYSNMVNSSITTSVLAPTNIRPIRLQYNTPTTFIETTQQVNREQSASSLSISPMKIDLNMNGQIKLIGDNKTAKLDIRDIIDNASFKNDLIKMISEELNKRGNLLGILNKESPVTRYYGVANPSAKA